MNSRGSVIILVLVTVLLAGFLLASFLQRANGELLADARAMRQARLRREAYSALEVTRAVLADLQARDGAHSGAAPDWKQPMDYADYHPQGVQLQLSVEDETARLSLPQCNRETLANLFVEVGLDRMQAERSSEALLAWMQPTESRDSFLYRGENPPHRPARRSLRSCEELASVAVVRDLLFDESGRPNEKYRRFTEAISLHAFPQTNLPAASPAVRSALRQPSPAATPDRTMPLPALLRITLTATAGGISYRMIAVLSTAISGSGQSFLEIREDLPNPLPAPRA